jgi:hypothetical protein
MNYNNKYLKYKNKYLKLKYQLGGFDISKFIENHNSIFDLSSEIDYTNYIPELLLNDIFFQELFEDILNKKQIPNWFDIQDKYYSSTKEKKYMIVNLINKYLEISKIISIDQLSSEIDYYNSIPESLLNNSFFQELFKDILNKKKIPVWRDMQSKYLDSTLTNKNIIINLIKQYFKTSNLVLTKNESNKNASLLLVNNRMNKTSNLESNQSNKLVFNIVIPDNTNYLNFLTNDHDPNNINSLIFDLTETYGYIILNKKFDIEMTHLLLEINDNKNFCLSALYCYDPMIQYNHIENIKDILNKIYENILLNKSISHKYYSNCRKIIEIINSSIFWEKKMYFRIGKLSFIRNDVPIDGSSLYIDSLKAWNMKKGGGTMLIYILLKMNLNDKIKNITLTSADNILEEKYYIKKLNFKKYERGGLIAKTSNLIKKSFVKNLPKINLILKNNNEYISNFEEFKKIFISYW